jgi:glyoxylase-like metal-dependent hydrolase (beta-lactamase superfamily II)
MKVERLIAGWFTAPAGIFRKDDDLDRTVRYPVPVYVIETDSERILIDAGLNPAAIADPAAYYERPDVFAVATLEQEQSVAERVEWEAGHDEAAVQRNFFLSRDYVGEDREVVLIEGDHDLLGDGSIELLHTPGHTPGHQSIRIGELVLGIDVAHFASGFDDHRFPIFADDHEQQARSAERLRAMRDAGLTVIPGHDPEIVVPGVVTA